jgi:hypothetical protein
MRYYRYPETGELVRFDLARIGWSELRCDATTQYRARWIDVPVERVGDPARLIEITQDEAERFQREADKANSAARGELLLNRTHVKGGQWPGPFPV